MKQVSVRRRSKLFSLIFGFFVVVFLVVGVAPLPGQASLITSDPGIPPLGGEYTHLDAFFALYAGSGWEIALKDVRFGNFTNEVRTLNGADEDESFDATLSGLALFESGGSGMSESFQLAGSVTFKTIGKAGRETGTFDMVVVAMRLTGEVSGFGYIEMRESQTVFSYGQTQITDRGDGTFLIDSFFDLYTELSRDGGQTWVANQNTDGTRMELYPAPVPEPATLLLLGFGFIGLARFMRKVKK